ncbi:MAG: hypothetical protein J2P16_01875 [Mycobacterium sp.]|nr:hypothetical protein [Mycobacterium sp.]
MIATRLNTRLGRTTALTVKDLGRAARSLHGVRSITRRAMMASALLVALSLAFPGGAAAQTAFQASVSATESLSAGPCSNGAYGCGTASIAGYGDASWNFYVTGATSVPTACGSSYVATTQFTLASDPASTLVLDEAGSLCGLGHDGAAYRGYFAEGSQAYGHPFVILGSWTVDSASTGQFAGLGGSGTDRVNVAGAHFGGSYTGAFG